MPTDAVGVDPRGGFATAASRGPRHARETRSDAHHGQPGRRAAQAALLTAALLSACAFAPRLVQLEPLAPRSPAPQVARCLRVAPLVDRRDAPAIVGRNHTGMIEARTYSDAAAWIHGHLARSLAPLSGCSEGQTPAVLRGVVEVAHVDESIELAGEITIWLELDVGATRALAQRFTGGHTRVSHAASSEEFTITLYEALLDLEARVTPAVTRALLPATR